MEIDTIQHKRCKNSGKEKDKGKGSGAWQEGGRWPPGKDGKKVARVKTKQDWQKADQDLDQTYQKTERQAWVHEGHMRAVQCVPWILGPVALAAACLPPGLAWFLVERPELGFPGIGVEVLIMCAEPGHYLLKLHVLKHLNNDKTENKCFARSLLSADMTLMSRALSFGIPEPSTRP